MLYVKSYENGIVKIASTESDEIVDYIVKSDKIDCDDIRSIFGGQQLAGVVHNSVFVPSLSGLKAMQFIDYNDCTPVIINENHKQLSWLKYINILNYYKDRGSKFEYFTLGDIALMTLSLVDVATDEYYCKDGYLHVLVDESSSHFLYFKYKILDKAKLERLAVKKTVLGR